MQRNIQNIDLQACINGDDRAQFVLYEQYKQKMFGICLRYARNKEDAEDMLMQGFFKIFTDLKNYTGQGNFEGWMRKVMVNTALMHIRKHRAKEMNTISLNEEYYHNIQDDSFAKYEHNEYSKTGDIIIHLIQQLPAMQQVIFNLRVIEEEKYSFKEIAKMLEIPASTARSNYSRATTKLQKMYSAFIIKE